MVSPKGLKCWSFRFLFSLKNMGKVTEALSSDQFETSGLRTNAAHVYACALTALHCCQFVEPGFKSTKERGRPVPLRS